MVKRLNEKMINNKFSHTDVVRDRNTAIQEKVKQLHGSIFGKPLINFEIRSERNVWVPYCYLVYHYSLDGKAILGRTFKPREGEVAVIFDLNEVHPMQYDIYESGDIKLVNKANGKEYEVMEPNVSQDEMLIKAEEHIQFKIMKRFYGKSGKLKLKKKEMFYRPAVELEVIYKNGCPNMRYVYLDEFGIQSEHILGLKYRVEHKS